MSLNIQYPNSIVKIPFAMARLTTWFCIVLLAIASCPTSLAKNQSDDTIIFNLVDVIAGLSSFVPSIGPVLSKGITFVKIAVQHTRKNKLSDDDFERSDGVDSLSGKNLALLLRHLNRIKTEVPNEILIHQDLDKLYKVVNFVKRYYDEYVYKYVSGSVTYNSEAAKEFVKDFYLDKGLKTELHLIEEILTGNHQSTNLLQGLELTKDFEALLCSKKNSHQVRIVQIRHDILITELKALMLAQLRYLVVSNSTNSEKEKQHALVELEHFVGSFINRTEKIQPAIRNAMQFAPREFWKCDPPNSRVDGTIMSLEPIFRTYLTWESGLTNVVFTNYGLKARTIGNRIFGHCKRYQMAEEGFPRKNGTELANPVSCRGLVRECDDSQEASVCLVKDGDEYNYESIRFKNGHIWGKTDPSCTKYVNFTREFRVIGLDDVCACTCDEFRESDVLRYFSTLGCSSDFYSNKVITGVQFVRRYDHFVHFQIQQGILKSYGEIDKDSVKWKQNCTDKIDLDFLRGENFYKVTWDTKTINLDSLECPTDAVVTGLRFNKDHGSLRLELTCTPYNFTTGKLDIEHSKPVFVSEKREYRKINNQLPSVSGNTYVLDKLGSKINFTKSDNEESLGLHVVPFIDTQKVSMENPAPLAGISIIHRSEAQSSGFLAFKITSIEYSRHLEPESGSYLQALIDAKFEEFKNLTMSGTSIQEPS